MSQLSSLELNQQTIAKVSKFVGASIIGAAILTLAARTQVPFWPVPMTLQLLAVMGFAVYLGPRLATSTFATYLLAGLAGMPVFAGTPEKGIGFAYMAGPTGGFLVGLLIASAVTGYLAQDKKLLGKIAAMLIGLIPIYVLGLLWLANFVPADKVFVYGCTPFIAGDLFKIAIIAAGSFVLANPITKLKQLLS